MMDRAGANANIDRSAVIIKLANRFCESQSGHMNGPSILFGTRDA
jgi:hypothetical protein